jgi:5'-nucleotidase
VTRFNATITLTLVTMLVATFAVGCQSTKKDVPVSTSVTDVTATPSATPAPTPAYTPAPTPPSPAYASASDSVVPPSTGAGNSATPGSITGSSYTVKRGDTLYGIARGRYGDGKQWRKIVSANPGLQPSNLKVGQTIALP